MMNLVQIDIGKPPHKEGYNDNDGWQCCAVVLSPYDAILSHNDVSYWFNLDQYEIGGRIAKDCPSGLKITRGIYNNISFLQMEKLLMALILPHIKPHQFEEILKHVENSAFLRGKNAVRESLASVLEME
jgi:hypothetical protein